MHQVESIRGWHVKISRLQFSLGANTSKFCGVGSDSELREGGKEIRQLPVSCLAGDSDGTDILEAEATCLPEAAVPGLFWSGCVGLAGAAVPQEASAPFGLPFEKSAKAPRCLFLELNSTSWYVCSHL